MARGLNVELNSSLVAPLAAVRRETVLLVVFGTNLPRPIMRAPTKNEVCLFACLSVGLSVCASAFSPSLPSWFFRPARNVSLTTPEMYVGGKPL